VNIDEKDVSNADRIVSEKMKAFPDRQSVIVSHICATIEKDISEMDEEGKEMFMKEYGLKRLASERLIEDSFSLLGLISFFTFKGGEVRSWPIPKGITAQEAAGEVHTDMQRGFIAAQVIKFDDFKEEPDIAELKQKGIVKVEGKDYIVRDGDIIDFRFNV
jgi:ribosome-binding ATPase YchF (GTP1/OBG family)